MTSKGLEMKEIGGCRETTLPRVCYNRCRELLESDMHFVVDSKVQCKTPTDRIASLKPIGEL